MTWNESDHPRDELGRFTFSSGGGEENEKEDTPVLKGYVEKTDNPANILYGASQKKAQNEKILEIYIKIKTVICMLKCMILMISIKMKIIR